MSCEQASVSLRLRSGTLSTETKAEADFAATELLRAQAQANPEFSVRMMEGAFNLDNVGHVAVE